MKTKPMKQTLLIILSILVTCLPVVAQNPAGSPTPLVSPAPTNTTMAAPSMATTTATTTPRLNLSTNNNVITLPKAQVSEITRGIMLYGTMLSLTGITFGVASLIQFNAGNSQWEDFGKLSLGFSLAGTGFIIGAMATTSSYSQTPVFPESP